MTPEQMRLLYDYNAWANQRTLESCAPLTDEQFTRDLGSSFRSVRDTLAHILGAEWIWLERWNGRFPTALPATQQFATLAELRAGWEPVAHNLLEFAGSLRVAELAAPREYRLVDGTASAQPLWQMLQHLVNHGSYHRGQIATMLRQLGTKPVSTDLIRFYRERSG